MLDNVGATQAVPTIPGLSTHNSNSPAPEGYSTISLQDLMKEDVNVKRKYIALQLLKIVSRSSSSTGNG